jgi:hypothetical protein
MSKFLLASNPTGKGKTDQYVVYLGEPKIIMVITDGVSKRGALYKSFTYEKRNGQQGIFSLGTVFISQDKEIPNYHETVIGHMSKAAEWYKEIISQGNITGIEDALKWLEEHDLIKINRLEQKAGIPQRVLKKVLDNTDGRSLPLKYHQILIDLLKEYGLK